MSPALAHAFALAKQLQLETQRGPRREATISAPQRDTPATIRAFVVGEFREAARKRARLG